MGRIGISEDRTYFVKDGSPFFYLADTAWMAFEKLSLEEWAEYVSKRRSQGFNVVQISVLPITHDNSCGDEVLQPFGRTEEGKINWWQYEEEYFAKAEKMLEILYDADMIPCLHLLWVDYVPDTWAAQNSPDMVMPLEAVVPFVEYVVLRYKRFSPVYSVSGDTAFETERVIQYYREALRTVKEVDPECLVTMHLQPGAEWPEVLVQDYRLDFYSYQGGHFKERQDNNAVFAKSFLNKRPVRPIVNTEPPYEGHGWGFRYGRFEAFDIRQAIWHSILSGAKAGVSYGAHGVWMFHKSNLLFNNREFSDIPYLWRTALEFEGAWDAGWAKWICEMYHFYRLHPIELIEKSPDMIKSAMSLEGDLLAVYVPYNTELEIRKDLEGFEGIVIDLQKKHLIRPIVTCGEASIIHMPEVTRDMLMIFEKAR